MVWIYYKLTAERWLIDLEDEETAQKMADDFLQIDPGDHIYFFAELVTE